MTNNTNGVFEYLGVHLSAMNESLLQSYNDKIRVFPAMPSATTTRFVGRFTLLAKGGFLVSAREGSRRHQVRRPREHAGRHRAHRQSVGHAGAASAAHRATARSSPALRAAAFDLPTDAGAVYVVERVARPLSSYSYARITGSANAVVEGAGGHALQAGDSPPRRAGALSTDPRPGVRSRARP